MAAGLLKEGAPRVEIHSKCWVEQREKEEKNNLIGVELKRFSEDDESRERNKYESFWIYIDICCWKFALTNCLNGPRFAKVKYGPANLMHLLALEDKGIYA